MDLARAGFLASAAHGTHLRDFGVVGRILGWRLMRGTSNWCLCYVNYDEWLLYGNYAEAKNMTDGPPIRAMAWMYLRPSGYPLEA